MKQVWYKVHAYPSVDAVYILIYSSYRVGMGGLLGLVGGLTSSLRVCEIKRDEMVCVCVCVCLHGLLGGSISLLGQPLTNLSCLDFDSRFILTHAHVKAQDDDCWIRHP